MCHNRYIEYSLMYIGYECTIIGTLNIMNIHSCISNIFNLKGIFVSQLWLMCQLSPLTLFFFVIFVPQL